MSSRPPKTCDRCRSIVAAAQLAARLTDGTNLAFNRNLANRLWAHLMGRGLVHPLDMSHSANPPVNSELLAVLAEELARMKFDTRALLRELALTRAYQRSSDEQASMQWQMDVAASASSIAEWEREAQRLAGELPALTTAAEDATKQSAAAYEQFAQKNTVRETAEKSRAEAKKASDEAATAQAVAIRDVTAKQEILQTLAEARDKALAAAAKLPEDKPLAEAAELIKSRAQQIDEQLVAGASW